MDSFVIVFGKIHPLRIEPKGAHIQGPDCLDCWDAEETLFVSHICCINLLYIISLLKERSSSQDINLQLLF